MKDLIEIKIEMRKVDEGQYYCKDIRLSFDLPWTIYIVNGDLYTPYYRIYIADCLMCMRNSLEKSYEYISKLTREEAHIASM